jgi:glycosyltransferase involved in cell wall biosynthesis
MGDLPRVSIVTPSYNQARYLEETMLSVLDQGYPNLEYIVMDGGSTDGSVDIIRRHRERLAYWVSERDGGQCDALNRGFARATGEILAWLNSDDTYEPGAINAVAESLQRDPGTRLVYGEGWYVDDAGVRIRPCKFVSKEFRGNYLVNRDPILQQAAFWTQDLWEEVGPLDESLHWVFDWDWFIRAHQRTAFHYIPRFLANYRVHAQAKTRSKDIRRRMEQAWITRTYGSWWHPNHIVQQARIQAYRAERMTDRWPRWLASPIRALASVPVLLAEQAFYGMYTT